MSIGVSNTVNGIAIKLTAYVNCADHAVYDALIARAAEKSGAERLLTLNGGDFERGSSHILPSRGLG